MLRTTLTVLVTAAVVLFGARAFLHPSGVSNGPTQSLDCRKLAVCNVPITFDCVATNVTPTCTPTPVAPVILISTGNQVINFILDKKLSHTFNQRDGIKFTTTNAGSYLPCAPDTGDKQMQTYTCTNNLPAGTVDAYKYQVDVNWMFTVDPWAVNY